MLNHKKNAWPLVGNSNVVDFLSQSIANDRICHSYIFLGPSGLGKTTLAKYFSKVIFCTNKQIQINRELSDQAFVAACGQCFSCQQTKINYKSEYDDDSSDIIHSDFHLIKKEKDKKNISIGQIRSFINEMSMSSFTPGYKIGIIKGAESLSIDAANSLLKLLEEPRGKTVIILIASDLNTVPKTIISRSQVLNFYPIKRDLIYDYLINDYKVPRSQAKNLANLSLGRPALAVKFLEDEDFYNQYLEGVKVFLDFVKKDFNESVKTVQSLLSDSSPQELAKKSLRIIEIWEGVARDFILLDFGHNDLLQFQVLDKEIKEASRKMLRNKTIEIFQMLSDAREYLKSNVNPKLVFDNLTMNIISII